MPCILLENIRLRAPATCLRNLFDVMLILDRDTVPGELVLCISK